jgi:hypothetical protein
MKKARAPFPQIENNLWREAQSSGGDGSFPVHRVRTSTLLGNSLERKTPWAQRIAVPVAGEGERRSSWELVASPALPEALLGPLVGSERVREHLEVLVSPTSMSPSARQKVSELEADRGNVRLPRRPSPVAMVARVPVRRKPIWS